MTNFSHICFWLKRQGIGYNINSFDQLIIKDYVSMQKLKEIIDYCETYNYTIFNGLLSHLTIIGNEKQQHTTI